VPIKVTSVEWFRFYIDVITARCYTELGIATASRLSVRPSICDVEVSWSNRLV